MSNRPNTRGKARTFDLAAKRAARAEARQENPVLTFGDDTYELVPELPLAFVEFLNRGQIRTALSMLLVDPTQADSFVALGITSADLNELTEDLYGTGGLGEFAAS